MTSTPAATLPSVPLCTTPVTVPAAAADAKARVSAAHATAPRGARERQRRESHPSRLLFSPPALLAGRTRRMGHPAYEKSVVILRSAARMRAPWCFRATKNLSFFGAKQEERFFASLRMTPLLIRRMVNSLPSGRREPPGRAPRRRNGAAIRDFP